MLELLQSTIIQRELMGAVVIAIICPMIGIYIVLRRLSMIGDSLSHISMAGVAAGIMLGVNPVAGALAFTVIAALGIEKLREAYKKYSELSIMIMMSTGIAITSVISSKGSTVNLFSFLFGSIVTITKTDMYLIFGLAIFVLLFIKFLYRELFYIAFDEESARLAGVPVSLVNILFVIMTAVTISVSMRIVGILLVSSMMVLPVAASLQISKSFSRTMLFSVIFALIASVSGVFISYYLGIATGGTIVLLLVIMLVLTIVYKRIFK